MTRLKNKPINTRRSYKQHVNSSTMPGGKKLKKRPLAQNIAMFKTNPAKNKHIHILRNIVLIYPQTGDHITEWSL